MPYLGNEYKLRIITGYEGSEKIELVDGEFLAFVNRSRNSKKKIKLLYEGWLKDAARDLVEKKVRLYSEGLEVNPKEIVFKNLRSRWGSATKDGEVNFSVALLKSPTDIIDYVILHELCHLKIKVAT